MQTVEMCWAYNSQIKHKFFPNPLFFLQLPYLDSLDIYSFMLDTNLSLQS